MKKEQRKKNIEKYIKEMESKGLEVEKATEGKSIDTLAHSQRTYDNFMKRRKRVLERPKIVEEVKAIDKKLKKSFMKMHNRNRITDETKAIVKFNEGFELNKKNLRNKTKLVATDFFYTYFQELSLNKSDQKEINKLIKRFGTRLDLLYDFMDNKELLSFKYPFPKELIKQGYEDEYREHMRDRLETFKDELDKQYGL